MTAVQEAGPDAALTRLAECREPYLIGVRHHSPALAAAVPALLDAAGADVVCVELPSDFEAWLPYLTDPATVAPVALAGARGDGGLGFYPFADFSPELAALRWARDRGAEVRCCDLPLSEWDGHGGPDSGSADSRSDDDRSDDGGSDDGAAAESRGPAFSAALEASASGRDGDDLWDRAVEAHAPGSSPEEVRRAALAMGWALRTDAAGAGGVPSVDLAREARMRRTVAAAGAAGRRVAAVVGAFHAPALLPGRDVRTAPGEAAGPSPDGVAGEGVRGTRGTPADGALPGGDVPGAGGPVPPGTSLVPYAFALLDSRSGYPAGIRDPRWQQELLAAGGDPVRVVDAAASVITGVCRELRSAGHPAGSGEAAETLRVAADLARLRGMPAPGRGELVEAVTSVLGQGDPLGRGRAVAGALETVMVGAVRGRVAPNAPRSGLGPSVEAELAELRLPGPHEPGRRDVRLDPLRSGLDRRREVLLHRLRVCGAGYGDPGEVAGTGDGAALSTRWSVAWTPSVAARLDLAGVRGVTARQAAAGTLRTAFRQQAAEGGASCAQVLDGLRRAARCDLPELVGDRLAEAAATLPSAAGLPELLEALDLLQALRREHLPGTDEASRTEAAALADVLLEAAVRVLPGLAGSDRPEDAAALTSLAARAAEERLGLGLDEALAALARTASPLMQGAALAARVLLGLESPAALGLRAAGWTDAAGCPEGRRRLTGLLAGVLTAAGPLLRAAPACLEPLLTRVETLGDRGFLDRLPALRAGFDTLTPAGRERLLETVAERLGERPDTALAAPPELLARWAAADAAGLAALHSLPIAFQAPGTPGSGDAAAAPVAEDGPGGAAPHVTPDAPVAASARIGPGGGETTAAPAMPETAAVHDDPAGKGAAAAPAAPSAASPSKGLEFDGMPHAGAPRIDPADRWRLLLGRQSDRLPTGVRRYAQALDELYGAGRGEGADDVTAGTGGGREASFPGVREWSGELRALFGPQVREEVLAQAVDAGRTDVLAELDPHAVRPSMGLLTSVLKLAGGLPEQQLARLRPLVRRLVEELARELSTRLRPALFGLGTPRPTRRPGGALDLARTLHANIVHARRLDDGRTVVVPERPVFRTRARQEADWRLILAVDVSGSMEASVVWSALTAAVLGGVPALSTHFLAFSTEVVDLSGRIDDPLSLLLEVRVGGGTHIAAGLAHARTLVTAPSRTLVVVVSDFEEGGPVGELLGQVRALAASGVQLLGCAALDDDGTPRYSVPVARQLVAAGMPVAALSPDALARWVGERLRGETR
ncbi:DUF5682 family protein [Streptomyces sp. HNM0663]|uniref:DUF5682 family protein n=1 Tax=Streptomyces chengmaiensis TaxID=3040919 RepID=A0ABT6HQP8_9ACTN|nr:DUF5682 family protein [Streptomyces chengmaiensis]MDH2390184.1 DUF5682 family protein [Streptomyces chengmaiensis]